MSPRPIIKLPLSSVVKIAEISGKCLIILLWILTIIAFTKMPDTVPIHFNAAGQADNFGNKGTIFILPVIATVIYILLTLLNQSPHIFNYSQEITAANAVYQYRVAARTIRFIKLIITILFTIIVLGIFLASFHLTLGLGSWFLPVTVVLILTPTIYALLMNYHKKQH